MAYSSTRCSCAAELRPQEFKRERKKPITDHANPEGNGPLYSKDRGRRGSTGPPQPEQRRQKHHHQGGAFGIAVRLYFGTGSCGTVLLHERSFELKHLLPLQVLFQPGPPAQAGLRQKCPAGKQCSHSSVQDFGAALRIFHHDQALPKSMCL